MPATSLAEAVPALPPARAAQPAALDPARAQRRRRDRLVTMAMVFGSQVVSSILFGLLWATGAVPWLAPVAYAAAAFAACGVFFVVLGSGWTDRLRDHYVVMPHMAAHALIVSAFILWVPQAGVLLMMALFVIFAFGALRMNLLRVLVGSLAMALVVGAMIAYLGPRLALPVATVPQRVVSGLWIALILVSSTLIGLYGSRMRSLLRQRNAQLAATFEQLERLAHHDELTGTLNRRSIMQLLEDERQRMERTGQAFGIALLDIDHFKRINDGHGHVVGDEVLRRFAQRVAAEMRHTDRLGRYGGEEFLMLLTATTDDAAALAAAERVRRGVAGDDWAAVAPQLAITVSAGIGVCRGGESIEQLLQRADAALYRAKHDGRNRVCAG
jgi:diguanylate cyclase (GGDEF)-like protein